MKETAIGFPNSMHGSSVHLEVLYFFLEINMSKYIVIVFASLLVLASAQSTLNYCGISPDRPPTEPKLTNPPASYNLSFVQTIIRHGDRLPIDRCWANDGIWDCNLDVEERAVTANDPFVNVSRIHRKRYLPGEEVFPGSCMAGQLTNYGYRQQIENGNSLRRRYINQRRVLPNIFDPNTMRVRSTDVPRTLQSGQGLLRGLYPWPTDGSRAQSVDVFTVDPAREWMIPNPGNCPLLAKYEYDAKQSTGYIQFKTNVLDPLMKEMADAYGLPLEMMPIPIAVFDCLSAHKCHNMPFPGKVTDKLWERIVAAMSAEYKYVYDYPSPQVYGRLALGRMYYQLWQSVSIAESGRSPHSFELFSGHDTTIMPFLNGIGAWDGAWAPYASNIVIETWTSSSNSALIRFLYNGAELKVPACKGIFCSFQEFSTLMSQVMIKDANDAALACTLPPMTQFRAHKPTLFGGSYSVAGW